MKRRMHLISSEAKTELKQNVYRNHTKFIETAKEVSSLESEVYQLHSLLADEKQLLNTVKELLNVENKVDQFKAKDLFYRLFFFLRLNHPKHRIMNPGKHFFIIVKVSALSLPILIDN